MEDLNALAQNQLRVIVHPLISAKLLLEERKKSFDMVINKQGFKALLDPHAE